MWRAAARAKLREFWYGTLHKRWEAGAVQSNGKNVVNGEEKLAALLRNNFPKATYIQVTDVSGGCGAMFEVSVESNDFKNLSIVKQHRLVNQALSEEIKEMHGIRIQTSIPTDS